MKSRNYISSFITVLFVSCTFYKSYSQDFKRIAEHHQELKNAQTDSAKITALTKLADKYAGYSIDSTLKYGNKAIAVSKNSNRYKGISYVYNSMGDAYWYKSDYVNAQEYYFKSYQISDSINDESSKALALYSMGWIFCVQQHDLSKLNYLHNAKRLYHKRNDTIGIANTNYAIAKSYIESFHYDVKNKPYYDSALYYLNRHKTFINIIDNSKDEYYFGMMLLQYYNNDFKSAVFYGQRGLEILKTRGNKTDGFDFDLYITLSKINLNETSASSLDALNSCYTYFNIQNNLPQKAECLKGYALFYYKTTDYKKAYEYGLQYYDLKNQLDKLIYSSQLSNLQNNYSLGKSQTQIDILKHDNEIQELKNTHKTYYIIGSVLLIIAALVFLKLLHKKNQQKHKANEELQYKNHIIAEKISEIDKSIQYAKGIQQAVLPNLAELSDKFNNSFIYYEPKDVVSGDFYWFAKIDGDFYCVVADCTGHGVPGAFMSVIGINKLHQALFENKLKSPSAILSFLNIQIKQALKQHSVDSKQKDGMDMALLKFNVDDTCVEYCAANRPLIIIRNNELIEYKANKTAIAGFTPDDFNFITTTIELKEKDGLYLFTDGYADQFGGADGKKFMSKQLKQLLLSCAPLSSQEQQKQIAFAFDNWKKDFEQVDDVLLLGIKI